ncbi:hypothetical protein BH11ACT3_BH11ACT3_10730 [soil metagenome]
MPSFARRFRREAAIGALLALSVVVAVVLGGFLLARPDDMTLSIVAWAVGLALAVVAGAQAIISFSRIIALRNVKRHTPDGMVFLARRQPALVSDLASYIADPEIYDQVSDRWVVASIDARGMGAWSVGRDARELILVPWQMIGSIEPIELESGRPGVAVDVKPYPTPLVVAVGYAAFGVMAAFGRRGVDEVVATANSVRPRSD